MITAQIPWPNSLWKHTASTAERHPQLLEEITADVTVIGADYTGLQAALVLMEAGSRVVVLD